MSALSHEDRVNVGCGATPTPGWINLDNSPTVRLAQLPFVRLLVSRVPELRQRTAFLRAVQDQGIRWASATRLPLASGSMAVVYTSHMLEHLNVDDARTFLAEAHRVLRPGGVLRIAVPDLRRLVQQYIASGDADGFINATLLTLPRSTSLLDRVQLSLFGHRGHAWLYDEASLTRLVSAAGFTDVRAIPAGETRIESPTPLNLYERAEESLYVEGTRA